MPKATKKPVTIDYVRYNGSNLWEVIMELNITNIGEDFLTDDLLIDTLEGEMRANPGDYIIKGVKGEIYPIKADIFEMTYDRHD